MTRGVIRRDVPAEAGSAETTEPAGCSGSIRLVGLDRIPASGRNLYGRLFVQTEEVVVRDHVDPAVLEARAPLFFPAGQLGHALGAQGGRETGQYKKCDDFFHG